MTASTPPKPLPPGATIGILGGGQLGRMLAMAAARLGLRSHIYSPDGACPAKQVVATTTIAAYEDKATLAAFARAVDVVTYEFENVPQETAAYLEALVPVRPSPHALAVSQDRLFEKTFLQDAGIATARFTSVADARDLRDALDQIGAPAVLKTRRFGYDGKGQAKIQDVVQAADAWGSLKGAPAILEAFVDFACEVSVIVARGANGDTFCYDPVRNIHDRHILCKSIVPAGIPDALAGTACAIAEEIVARLGYVGVMGVEMFVCDSQPGGLLVNEVAPRVHNSGHWTLDACVVSQFEQHCRAICGWPLGSTWRHADAVMVNLLGEAVDDWQSLGRGPATALHIYGKNAPAPGRKMGHATRLFPLGAGPSPEEA